jgi:hypothetical protein
MLLIFPAHAREVSRHLSQGLSAASLRRRLAICQGRILSPCTVIKQVPTAAPRRLLLLSVTLRTAPAKPRDSSSQHGEFLATGLNARSPIRHTLEFTRLSPPRAVSPGLATCSTIHSGDQRTRISSVFNSSATVSCALSNRGGPNVPRALFENPYGSVGIPSPFFVNTPLPSRS